MKKIVTIALAGIIAGTLSANAATKAETTKKSATTDVAIKKELHTNETKDEQIKRLVSEGKITQAQADAIEKMDKKRMLASSTATHVERASSSAKKAVKKVVKTAKKTSTKPKGATTTTQ